MEVLNPLASLYLEFFRARADTTLGTCALILKAPYVELVFQDKGRIVFLNGFDFKINVFWNVRS